MQPFSLERLIEITKKYSSATDENFSHIAYDQLLDEDGFTDRCDPGLPKKHADFRLIRYAQHDGTLLFTLELIFKTFVPLVNKQICRTGDEEIPVLGYKVGKLQVIADKCPKSDRCFTWPHTHELTCLPVKVIYNG